MILGQISSLDCIAFIVLLIPQLLLRLSFLELAICSLKALLFLGLH